MKRPNITPGPWNTGLGNELEVFAAEHTKRIVDNSTWRGECSRESYPNEERAANAKAIAALPDLLSALEIVLPHIPDSAFYWSNADHGKRLYVRDAVTAALTKAGYENIPD